MKEKNAIDVHLLKYSKYEMQIWHENMPIEEHARIYSDQQAMIFLGGMFGATIVKMKEGDEIIINVEKKGKGVHND